MQDQEDLQAWAFMDCQPEAHGSQSSATGKMVLSVRGHTLPQDEGAGLLAPSNAR